MSSTAVEFGLINTFRTGHLVLDTLLCMLVPLAIQKVMSLFEGRETSLLHDLYLFFFPLPARRVVTRVIETSQRFNKYGKIWDSDDKNVLLQKAISLYLADVVSLKQRNAQYELLEKPKKKKQAVKSLEDDASDHSGSTVESDDDSDDGAYYGEVDKLNVEVLPPVNEWINVADGVKFIHEIVTAGDEGEDGKKKAVTETKVVFKFTSSAPDGTKRIDAFIDQAFRSYQEAERRKHVEDKTRYYYIQSGSKGGASSEPSTVSYKRYALGEEKTFENLFFDEKDHILQLLDNFANRSGKFAIKGFPYKLGLLLHGPPGTGKTSLIKAIAQYTKRHIVTISLGKIKTNQELLDALFDMKFAVHGNDTPFEMDFEDVVFVMEDIDCASSIVNARDEDEKKAKKKESSGREERMRKSQKKAEKTDDDDDMPGLIGPLLKPKNTDKLNLSGLLNVLDGVIDCPGRILIMTTNHPEKLDPALIRPGRVNKKLFLTHMRSQQAKEMIEYYCSSVLTAEQTADLDQIFELPGFRATPAEVEEVCAEYDDADAILKALNKLALAKQDA